MSGEQHPADARRRAEEWLTRYDGAVPSIPPGSADPPEVRLLRALLASLPDEEGLGPLRESAIGYTALVNQPPAPQPAPTPPPPSDAVREAAEDVVRGDWWGHYCPCCGATVKHGPECLIGRLAKALAEARAAKGGAE